MKEYTIYKKGKDVKFRYGLKAYDINNKNPKVIDEFTNKKSAKKMQDVFKAIGIKSRVVKLDKFV